MYIYFLLVSSAATVLPESSMSASNWKKRCEDEWGLQGVPMPDSLDWKSVYDAKPFGRNLIKNPSPYGTNSNQTVVEFS